jgi:peptidoglycan/xylan/chitin deacetylase (PgdA/CDA1 family)
LVDFDLLIPHWHIAGDFPLKHISGLYKFRTLRQFRKDIDYFSQRYTPISLDTIINYLDGKERLPKKSFMPSFDDGFSQIHEFIAPILLEKGIPSTFFLTTSTIDNKGLCYPQKKSLILCALAESKHLSARDLIFNLLCKEDIPGSGIESKIMGITYHKRHLLDQVATFLEIDFAAYCKSVRPYLTSEQIVDLMKKGFEIGAHSIDHPNFMELSIDEQLKQVEESIDLLSAHLSFPCRSFAFPFTDAGISKEFFLRAFQNKALKVMMGYGVIGQNDKHPRNLSRFSMERTNWSTRRHLVREFGKAFFKKH